MTDYFKVEYLGQDVQNNRVIASGTSFGFINHDIVFKVTTVDSDTPLKVKFGVYINKDKKPFEFEVGKIVNNEMSIKFYNPNETGTSGLSAPLSLVVVDKKVLGFMFFADTLSGSMAFRITYEFYHGVIVDEQGAQQ